MTVSIEMIKKLRETTGVSMMACKSALEEANGDFEAAIDLLRKKGEAKAADRAERTTSEGVIAVKIAGRKGAMIKLECETDFVAKGEDFHALAAALAQRALNGEISTATEDISEVKDAVLRLGENVRLGEVAVIEADVIGSYVHSNGKIGVLVGLSGGNEDLAKDVAMHAAATNPRVMSPEEIGQDLVDREKSIWTEQLANEGKPAEIVEKIMMGKEKKFREENALNKQQFVKNPDKTVEQLLSEGGASLLTFVRFAI